MVRISGMACVFLVALRLAIGWHFAVEGYFKIRSHQIGKTSTNTPWTAEPFFREGYGPIAEWYRGQLGLSDAGALARLRNPDAVAGEWSAYRDRLQQHYALADAQRSAVNAALQARITDLRNWLTGAAPSPAKKPLGNNTVDAPTTVPARLAEYDARLQEARQVQDSVQPAFNKPVDLGRVRTAKAEAARILGELTAELDARTAAMRQALRSAAALTDEQKKRGEAPEPPAPRRPIQILDTVTMWTLAILGGCLVVGLLSRLASLLLAGFLLQVVLIAPALPHAPQPPGAVGHFLYVNHQVIEMLALLVLAAIPTGRWFGLDALWNRRGPTNR